MINISENTANSIIKLLNEYLNSKKFDLNNVTNNGFYTKEDVELVIKALKILGELQGAVNAVKELDK